LKINLINCVVKAMICSSTFSIIFPISFAKQSIFKSIDPCK
ncbi:unnamed protein product, partial [Heterotrigona itama]